jgi:hypothetical protein
MSLESDFKTKTMEFLGKYVLIVAADAEADKVSGISALPKHFTLKLRQEGGNVVELLTRPGLKAGDDVITAYWLPWRTKSATTLKLGDAAEFFFTSEMTNCRFSILTPSDKEPVVAHIAGTASKDERNALERAMVKEVEGKDGWKKATSVLEVKDLAKLKDLKPDDPPARGRSLSVSGAPELHAYKGQRARFEDSGSAFVFGKFTDKAKWKFYAQICGGNITPDNIAHGKIPKEVKQLGNLFDFG